MISWSRLIGGALLLVCCLSLSAVAADETTDGVEEVDSLTQFRPNLPTTYEQPDTIFLQVSLSPDGVIAMDTFGNYWQYDFTTAVFIPYKPSDAAEEDMAEPVENRCTRKHANRPFAIESLIGFNEYAEGNVIAFGRIVVNGWVQGTVQSINGRVIVGRSGQVDGDIRAPEIEVRPGGVVSGEQFLTKPYNLPIAFVTENALAIILGSSLLLLFTAFLIVSLMSSQLHTINLCIMKYRRRTYIVGLLCIAVLVPLLLAVMVVSVVGWVFVPLVPFVIYLAAAMGITACGYRIGHRILGTRSASYPTPMLSSLIGVALLGLFWFGSIWLLKSDGPVFSAVGTILLSIVAIYSSFPIFTGIGSSLLTRLGWRPYLTIREIHTTPEDAPAPAPPPIPEVPPTTVAPERVTELVDNAHLFESEEPDRKRPLIAGEEIPDHLKSPADRPPSSE